ncbi:MAG: HAMP domain-containing protein [Spirochaetaceae bacterium]|jgi:adenylate cyclase|nr:HAMP domain-containing protein [Spirochaetaceae bacterium]
MRGGSELVLSKKKAQKVEEKAVRVRYPIGMKLVIIITFLLLVSLGSITYLVSWLVGQDVQVTAEDNNFTVNQRSASEAQAFLRTVHSASLMMIDILGGNESRSAQEQTKKAFFQQNQAIAALILVRSPYGKGENSASFAPANRNSVMVNGSFFAENEIDPSLAESFISGDLERFASVRSGGTAIQNVTPHFTIPLLALFFPFQENGETYPAIVLFSPDTLAETFETGNNLSFLINGNDEILVHPDAGMMDAGLSMASNPFVKEMRVRTDRRFQTRFADENGVPFFGAFQKLDIANTVVITSIPEDMVFEGVNRTTLRNLYLTAAVLFLSIMFVYLFSKTISIPLRRLTRAAGQIERGTYALDLKANSRDEIGVLTNSFVKMGKGLAERERLKDTFGRFTNKVIAERAMRDKLVLGGETKEATIFFSDIRSFTAISEKMEPDEVVGFLNDYMTRMVACVNKTGGVVDKFIGDAVMAVWGAPMSAGSPVADALACVKAALMMRAALREFNVGRGGDKKPVIKIGCGINSGTIVAGQIGSTERMEYTVIGDAVNLASRTETLNKPLGTDILITENTWRLIGRHLITEEMPPVSIKGKEKPVRMFAVVNLKSPAGMPQAKPATLAEVRTMLGTKAPNLSKVNMNAEEKKYKIRREN